MNRKSIPQHRYVETELQFLRENSSKMMRKELTEQFNEKFGTSISVDAIKSACCNRGIKGMSDGRIQKGDKSWCKGMEKEEWEKHHTEIGLSRIVSGQYGHGRTRDDGYPVGYELWRNGYLCIKVSNSTDIQFNKRWKFKHTYIWESHYGCVPNGYMIIFKDGDRSNCDIKNLLMISRKQNVVMAKNRLHNVNPELTVVGANVAKLLVTIGAKNKNKEREDSQ